MAFRYTGAMRQPPPPSPRVRAEQLRLLLERNRLPSLSVVPFAALVYWLLAPHVSPTLLHAWFALKCVMGAALLVLFGAYWRAPGSRAPERWLRLYLWLLAADGLSWSMMATVLVPPGDVQLAAAMFAAIVGVSAVAGVALSSSFRALALSVVSMLVPVIGWHLFLDSPISVFGALGLMFLLVLLLSDGYRACASTLELLRLRFEVLEIAEQRAQALAAAEEHSAVKSRFLATMSHEMRTPLHGILGTLSLLDQRPLGTEDRQRLAIVSRSGDHLLDLINDVLDFSRLEARQLQFDLAAFDVAQLVDDVHRLHAAAADDKGLALRTYCRLQRPCWMLGDARRVRQVVLNLVGNAVKFTDRGDVTVELARDADDVRIAVRDTGVGIAAGDVARVFAPFQQADTSSTRKHSGTGLGLTISRELARAMGGDIDCESTPGRGSCFTLRLPWQPAEAPAPTVDATSRETGGERRRVLIAEDNPVNVLVATAMLEQDGLEVTCVENGALAVARSETLRPDLILMDCRMPVMDGFEATRAIRAEEMRSGRPRVPIVAVTANALPEERARCLAVGMDDHLAKPFTADALRQTVRRNLASASG